MHDSGFGDSLVGFAFFLGLAAIIVAVIVMRGLYKREVQRTIRIAMEKGQDLDPKLLDRLLGADRPRPEPAGPEGFYVGGLIAIATGVGLAVMGVFASRGPGEEGTLFGMLGVGLMVGIIGAGILLAGRVYDGVRRRRGGRDDAGAA